MNQRHNKWLLGKARQWLNKAGELDGNGLFVAAGVARCMCLHYLLKVKI